MTSKKSLVLFSLVFLVVAFAGGAYLYRVQKSKSMQFLADKNFSLFVRDYSPRMGDKDAEVYLVEFLDPECEACRMIYPYVKQIMKDYEGKIQLVVRYAPFHGNSKMVVKVLEATRLQGKYWESLELLFKTQPEWGDHHHPQPELIWQILLRAGVNVAKVQEDMERPEIAKILEQDIKDLEVLGVRRTPSFFVNGKPLEKFGPQHLRDLIDSVLEEKK